MLRGAEWQSTEKIVTREEDMMYSEQRRRQKEYIII